MDRTTLTRNLKPLVDAGWVRMRQDRLDARARSAELTAAGRELLDARAPAVAPRPGRDQRDHRPLRGRALHALADAALPRLRPAEDGDAA